MNKTTNNKETKLNLNDEQVIIKIATWNILADGLSKGEFISDCGDELVTSWNIRGKRIANIIYEMFNNLNIGILSTQENDHPEQLLNMVHENGGNNIKLVKLLKYSNEQYSINRKFLEKREPLNNDIQNDSISIYYDSNLYNILEYDIFPLNIKRNTSDTSIIEIKSYGGHALFQDINNNNNMINIINCHLTSGENVKSAIIRQEECQLIINKIQELELKNINIPTIITMDSNSSKNYPDSNNFIVDAVNNCFNNIKYKNIIDIKGNECVKMRHCAGGQPGKFAELMCDTIDKILIHDKYYEKSIQFSKQFNIKLLNLLNNNLLSLRLIPIEIMNEIRNLREDKNSRSLIKEIAKNEIWCDKVGWGKGKPTGYSYIDDDTLDVEINVPTGTISGTDGGSIMKKTNKIPLYDDEDYFWDVINNKYICYKTNTIYSGDIKLNDNNIFSQNIQHYLMPNTNTPSDHPPCICVVVIS